MNSVGFVGGGRIVRVFLSGWKQANCMPPAVTVSDPSADALAKLKELFPQVQTTTDNTVSASQEIVFLAVHPPVAKEVLPLLAGSLKARLLVSLAPVLTTENLSGLLRGFPRIARTIPNAPSAVAMGFNPVAFGSGTGTEDQERVLALLRPLGDCPIVSETDLEAYALISGRGPTYLWPLLFELIATARTLGLSAGAAVRAVEKTVLGSLALATGGQMSADEAMDLIPVKPMSEAAVLPAALRASLPGLLAQMRGVSQPGPKP